MGELCTVPGLVKHLQIRALATTGRNILSSGFTEPLTQCYYIYVLGSQQNMEL
jgi:hypothetical protein